MGALSGESAPIFMWVFDPVRQETVDAPSVGVGAPRLGLAELFHMSPI